MMFLSGPEFTDSANFLDNGIGDFGAASISMSAAAQIVDYNAGTSRAEQKCVCSTESCKSCNSML